MAPSRRRQRELARAKWERQHQRRSQRASRQRRASLVIGSAAGVVVVGLISWAVVNIVQDEQSQTPTEPIPTFLQPTQTGPTIVRVSPGTPTAATGNATSGSHATASRSTRSTPTTSAQATP
ncbi:MAG: hypothetical protein ACRDPG_09800 [Nocardioidaceae bacterium]